MESESDIREIAERRLRLAGHCVHDLELDAPKLILWSQNDRKPSKLRECLLIDCET